MELFGSLLAMSGCPWWPTPLTVASTNPGGQLCVDVDPALSSLLSHNRIGSTLADIATGHADKVGAAGLRSGHGLDG